MIKTTSIGAPGAPFYRREITPLIGPVRLGTDGSPAIALPDWDVPRSPMAPPMRLMTDVDTKNLENLSARHLSEAGRMWQNGSLWNLEVCLHSHIADHFQPGEPRCA